ncbi:MAG: patatin family protein [Oscillospiraceae bacterium]|nr:patatin family protein [Oscillospiraceae bacterium]
MTDQNNQLTGLVLEGGTFRGIFSAGVMDAFIEAGVEFPYVIGVSAGISNGVSYVSKQFKRNVEIMDNYRNDKRYIGAGNFLKCKSFFGLDFVFGDIPHELVPFDYDTFYSYKGKVMVGVTNALTGKAEFLDGLKEDRDFNCLRATCAIPGYFPAIEIDGTPYYDGGLACPIAITRAIKDGCQKNIIVLTQPEGFVKKCGKGNIFMSQVIRAKYPEVELLLLARHRIYNKQVRFCEELERRGKAIILRPAEKLDSFEKDTQKLRDNWQMGYDMAMSRMDEIKAFIGKDYKMYE